MTEPINRGIVALGGGLGLYATLSAARRLTPHVTAVVTVADDGVGLPEGQYMEGLGLQIVRTLVTSELGGSIQWSPRDGGGTAVEIVLNLARG